MILKITLLLFVIGVQGSFQQGYMRDGDSVNGDSDDEGLMERVPTGYLPDSVYRELAWYGISQIQPMLLSSKNRMAAMIMWQYTVGRPHVIMEHATQTDQSAAKISRQQLAEEATKWSKEQRTKEEVLMEAIRTGGNGLSVRTVVGMNATTTLIINGGLYYKCPDDSDPDYDGYQKDADNIHEKKCDNGKPAELLVPNIDPCVDAENSILEYSLYEGWMFCLGSAEREMSHFKNGTLDCGKKEKIPLNEVLLKCAFDNNVVISYEYFGDAPRKEPPGNGTICLDWNPCRLSYFYRLVPPEETPIFPTTEKPCEIISCPECEVGYTGSPGVPIELSEGATTPAADDAKE